MSLVASAAAFAPAKDVSRKSAAIATKAAMDDLKTIAEKSNPVLKVSSMIVFVSHN